MSCELCGQQWTAQILNCNRIDCPSKQPRNEILEDIKRVAFLTKYIVTSDNLDITKEAKELKAINDKYSKLFDFNYLLQNGWKIDTDSNSPADYVKDDKIWIEYADIDTMVVYMYVDNRIQHVHTGDVPRTVSDFNVIINNIMKKRS